MSSPRFRTVWKAQAELSCRGGQFPERRNLPFNLGLRYSHAGKISVAGYPRVTGCTKLHPQRTCPEAKLPYLLFRG